MKTLKLLLLSAALGCAPSGPAYDPPSGHPALPDSETAPPPTVDELAEAPSPEKPQLKAEEKEDAAHGHHHHHGGHGS